MAEEDSEALRVARVRVDEWTSERASLCAGIQQGNSELEALAARSCELEVVAATRYGELGFLMLAVQSLKGLVPTCKDGSTTAEARACKTLNKMSELPALVEGLSPTIGGERACHAKLVDVELIHVLSVITAALLESESTVREAICDERDGFDVEVFSDALGRSAVGPSDQA